jgi:hypothetical protein
MFQGHRKIVQRCNTNSPDEWRQLRIHSVAKLSNAVLVTKSWAVTGVKSFRGLEACNLVTVTIIVLNFAATPFSPFWACNEAATVSLEARQLTLAAHSHSRGTAWFVGRSFSFFLLIRTRKLITCTGLKIIFPASKWVFALYHVLRINWKWIYLKIQPFPDQCVFASFTSLRSYNRFSKLWKAILNHSVYLPACNKSRTDEQIFMKFGIWDLHW